MQSTAFTDYNTLLASPAVEQSLEPIKNEIIGTSLKVFTFCRIGQPTDLITKMERELPSASEKTQAIFEAVVPLASTWVKPKSEALKPKMLLAVRAACWQNISRIRLIVDANFPKS